MKSKTQKNKTAALSGKAEVAGSPSSGSLCSPPVEVLTEDELIAEKEQELLPVKSTAKRSTVVRPSWASAEKTLHAAAFEYYYKLGPSRSLPKVAAYFRVNEQTAQRWSAKYHWVKRCEERTKLELEDTNIHKKAEVTKVKKAVLDYIGEKLKAHVSYDEDGNVVINGGPEIKTIKEMAEAVGLYRELLGEGKGQEAGYNDGNKIQVNFVIKGRS